MRLGPLVVVALCMFPAPSARAQLKPTIRASAVPEAARFLNIEEVEADAPIRLDWTATITTVDTYEFEISYDAGRSLETTTSTLVRLDDDALEAGRNRGTVQSGRMERFHIRPSQIIDPTELPGQTGAVDNDRRNIVLRVFRSSNPLEAATSETFAWTFDFDTKPPSPPILTRVLPGENRLQVEWAPPSPDSDVDTYEVLYCPNVEGASPGAILEALPCGDPKSVGGIGKEQTTFSVESDLENGVPAAVAVRSVDPFGNKGVLSGIGLETPSEVSDFFELYKDLGGKEEGGFCFVATAAYGSYAHPTVLALRLFRDFVLKRSPAGTFVVWTYYRLSPPLALAVQESPVLARWVRVALLPAAGLAALALLAPLAGLGFFAAVALGAGRDRRPGRFSRVDRFHAGSISKHFLLLVSVFWASAIVLLDAPRAMARSPRAKSELRHFGIGLELKGGPYLPALGEKDGGPEGIDAFRRVFGSDRNPLYVVGMDFQLYRGIGTAGVGGSFGFMQFVGKAFFGLDGARASDTTVFNILPLTFTAFYRFDWLADRASVPLVPYVRGGLAYDFWWVTTGTGDVARIKGADPASTGDDVRGRGGKLGLVASAGMAFLLNVIEPGAAANLYESASIRGTYLFAEMQTSKVDGFGGDGFDLSDNTWNLGLYVEL